MSLRELKRKLNSMDTSEIITLVSEIYRKIPDAKNYLDVFTNGSIKELVKKYKEDIEVYTYPYGRNMVLREAEARKLIRSVRKMQITRLNIELELHYVSCCLDIIDEFGYSGEDYCIAIEKMFYSAVAGIHELGLKNKYTKKLELLSDKASTYGMDFEY